MCIGTSGKDEDETRVGLARRAARAPSMQTAPCPAPPDGAGSGRRPASSTCDMICMLKLGERDCLVSGAPGDRRSWASSGRMRGSSCRLMLEWRWELPAGGPPSSSEPPADSS
ncbi:hypothetical protein EYF80_035811 [Liparis tanakae]|uniref:Uncharacterized protein n=1 Tax=Liparis tanakae TaxID=230148 RepID=A0A4Z2GKE4_9TELE|nr:hypothetical protein EYF80_035811 [Liparis tanakae]